MLRALVNVPTHELTNTCDILVLRGGTFEKGRSYLWSAVQVRIVLTLLTTPRLYAGIRAAATGPVATLGEAWCTCGHRGRMLRQSPLS